jgi:hypothetical protein
MEADTRIGADPDSPDPASSSERSFIESIRAVERLAIANRATGAWLMDTVGDANAIERFSVVHGEFSDQVRAYAGQLEAQAIVVCPSDRHVGSAMASLAFSAEVPVLVSRESIGRDTIIAATDLRDSEYPVLNKAADWSRKLRASIMRVLSATENALTRNASYTAR